jgi:predicted PhzF superfamily epimerase YddE/YHI9
MSQPLYIVDAFTARPFAGNPAAVCPLAAARPDGWMRRVAAEMNLSETAFLHPEADGWRLRWFTPAVEVDLCGHATLASAHVLRRTGRCPPEGAIRFFTRSGVLTAERDGNWIDLDFPALPVEPCAPPPGLIESLGIAPRFVGNYRLDYLIEVDNEAVLRAVEPDQGRLKGVPTRGVVVTARSATGEFDFVSRFFAPGAGIPEDPVTGSAHCALGPYWAPKLGKEDLLGYQASRRGGVVRVRVRGPRVRLGGQAVTVVQGELVAD